MSVKIDPSWQAALKEEFKKPYFREVSDFVDAEYKNKTVFPPRAHIFNAFNSCAFDGVKVVIFGQDPYHGEGQAHGLCFSVQKGVKTPPSLRNIYKELKADIGKEIPEHGSLQHWADQGVLLLNATLTVLPGQPGSHQKKGWEEFTDAVVRKLSDEREGIVFLLWGNYAKQKGQKIDRAKHLVLEAPHPSPFSAHSGFFGCKHFSKTNDYLRSRSRPPIEW
jgi:uracil-DNA glycosylase